MARTALLSRLQRCFRLAAAVNRPAAPPVDELIQRARDARLTRRRFLAATAGVSTALAGAGITQAMESFGRTRRGQPRIAIVGAGFAGLHAAYRLRQAGFDATVYDAGTRVGGRVFSATDLLAPGLNTELGGEFVDTDHRDLRGLAERFGLELLDDHDDASLLEGFFFNGRFYSEAEVVEAYAPLATRIQADYDSLPDLVDFRHPGGEALDNTSLADYLDQIGATGFVRELLDVAYVTEYGLASEEQSSINLIFLIGTDTSDGMFHAFGQSDERFRVQGGNQQIAQQLAARLASPVVLEHFLESVQARGAGYTLTFSTPGGPLDVDADIVLLTVPFSVLRNVNLALDLPDYKTRAIQELGYGTNAKLLIGFSERIWRTQGYNGEVFTDESYQLSWDNSRLQPGTAGGLTLFFGGQPGLDVGAGTVQEQVAKQIPALEKAFPGITAAQNGNASRFHWPSNPLTLGSYSCWKVGQYTTIAGAEIQPIGNLFFAGEHCSYDFQGFMNGALETGRRAANGILRRIR